MTTSHTTPPAIDEQKKRDFILQAAMQVHCAGIISGHHELCTASIAFSDAEALAEEAQKRGLFNQL